MSGSKTSTIKQTFVPRDCPKKFTHCLLSIGSVVLQVKNIYTLNCKIVLFLKSRKSIKIYFFTSKCQSKETSPLSIALNQDKPEEQYNPRYSPFCIEMAGR